MKPATHPLARNEHWRQAASHLGNNGQHSAVVTDLVAEMAVFWPPTTITLDTELLAAPRAILQHGLRVLAPPTVQP